MPRACVARRLLETLPPKKQKRRFIRRLSHKQANGFGEERNPFADKRRPKALCPAFDGQKALLGIHNAPGLRGRADAFWRPSRPKK